MKQTLLRAGMTLGAVLAVAGAAMAQPNSITWSGRVDDTIRIHFQGSTVSVDVLNGKDVRNMRYQVLEPLPAAPIAVRLEEVEGRGSVRLVHGPHDTNDETATIEINDPQPGSGFYRFTLLW